MMKKLAPLTVFVAALALTACGGSSGAHGSAAATTAVVGPAGAHLLSASGKASLDIPKDALSSEIEIQMVETFDDSGRHEIEIDPKGLKFANAAQLTFKLSDDMVPEREHAVEVGDDNGVETETEVHDQIADDANHQIEAHVDHSGSFRREDRPL